MRVPVSCPVPPTPVFPQPIYILASVLMVPTTVVFPATTDCATIASPAPLNTPVPSLIHPYPKDSVFAHPCQLPRLPEPAPFLTGHCVAPCSSRSRLALIVNKLENDIVDETSRQTTNYFQLIRGPDRDIWIRGMENVLGHLDQDVGNRLKGTDTIFFIPKFSVRTGQKVTYHK